MIFTAFVACCTLDGLASQCYLYRYGFYLLNAGGDVVQRTNESGAVIRTYLYTAFGIEINPAENNTNPFRFAGEYYDWERGEIYLRARSFNPRTGRFTQPDPFWNISNMQSSSAAILQSGNLFVYVMHNPVRFIDPLGLFAMFSEEMFSMSPAELREAGISFATSGNRRTGVTISSITMEGITFRSDGRIASGGTWNNLMTDDQRSSGYLMRVSGGVISVGQGESFRPVFQRGLIHTPIRDTIATAAAIIGGKAIGTAAAAGRTISGVRALAGTRRAGNSQGSIKMDLELFGNKRDIKMVNEVAKALKMSDNQRNAFGREVEELKRIAGKPGDANFTRSELLEIGRDVMTWTKR